MLEITVEKITPKIAKDYLKWNTKNPRGTNSLRRSYAKQLADDMTAGKWQQNAATIVFDEDGFLKDGQHRLAAVILSGKTIEFVVVRGVGRDVDIWNNGWKEGIDQMIRAKLERETNSCVSSAVGLIVNNFGPRRGTGIQKAYAEEHIVELERAYRIACYGGIGSAKSKCAPCIAATYLALRTESIPSYELELFFRIFNNPNNYTSDGYDPSAALVARRMFDARTSSGYQLQKEKLEIVVMAMQDFHEEIHRDENYKIAEPFHFSEWLDDIRRKDGLD